MKNGKSQACLSETSDDCESNKKIKSLKDIDPNEVLESFYQCKHDLIQDELLIEYYQQFKDWWIFKLQVEADRKEMEARFSKYNSIELDIDGDDCKVNCRDKHGRDKQ